jgi:leucyl aminopeptidase
MQRLFHTTANDLPQGTVAILPVLTSENVREAAQELGLNLDALSALPDRAIPQGRFESTLLPGSGSTPHIFLIGAGKRELLEPIILLRVFTAASRTLTGKGFTSLAYADTGLLSPTRFAHVAAEGAVRGTHDPGLRKTAESPSRVVDTLALLSSRNAAALQEGARVGQIVGEGSCVARDLVNLPPNDLTPSTFAERARAIAEGEGLEFAMLDQSDMTRLGMGSILGVAAGSDEPPRIFSLRFGAPDAATRLAVVGKGITFDSGGLAIKPLAGMETMKGDMGGAAAVVGGMVAVARLKPEGICVTGYVGASENMISGSAMRPGDVLTAMTGETIEVLNPDAEGRLVLADVLAYAVQEGATHIVDFATLTGAAAVALGAASSLGAGRPQTWVETVANAADEGYERIWPMPLHEDYRRNMDSSVADIKNTGPRGGGALNAAAFLADFVDDTPWAHIDIAGTSFIDDGSPYAPKGGTGVGVGTIAALATRMAGGNGT